MKKEQLSQLPKVDLLLNHSELQEMIQQYGRIFVKNIVQEEVNAKRKAILAGVENIKIDSDTLILEVKKSCERSQQPYLKSVINGTGVVLHTNLGRAVLSPKIQEDINRINFGYSNLEYDLEKGERGSRYAHLEADLLKLTGAESALVVNNNAAAVLLALQTFIKGKEIIVSRGELVEIGGSFRIPEIIALSGGIIREVGTTNKTHLHDYESAINENTGAILKVHTSNYKVIGFTESVSMEDLARLGSQYELPVMNDLGSGLLTDLSSYGFPKEETVQMCVAAGCDIVTFSGDKLLGGPQAGIIVGKSEYIEEMKKNQLLRALRVDKMTISALELTLKEYLKPEKLFSSIPTLQLLTLTAEVLLEKAMVLKKALTSLGQMMAVQVIDGFSQVGGGSYPGVQLPTKLVSCQVRGVTAEKLEKALRTNKIPIIVRIKEGAVQFDVRTILERDVGEITLAFERIIEKLSFGRSLKS